MFKMLGGIAYDDGEKVIVNKSEEQIKDIDSNHSMDHVLKEMNCYSKFVTKESYMIVEDSNLYGHPDRPDRYRFGKRPYEAIIMFYLNIMNLYLI